MQTLSELHSRYSGRPPKHLLEQALSGKSSVEIAIDTWRRQAQWNTAKARDWDRAARFADMSTRTDAPARAVLHRETARLHRTIAHRQYRNAAQLAGLERAA